MTKIKTLFGSLVAVVAAAVVGVVAFGAAQASASSAPIVIPYEKECDAGNHCEGEAGEARDGTLVMDVTFTGKATQLTLTEQIKVGGISFTAEMKGHLNTAEWFIVLNGTVTEGSFEGAQVHQRSNLAGINGNKTVWKGELRLMPSS